MLKDARLTARSSGRLTTSSSIKAKDGRLTARSSVMANEGRLTGRSATEKDARKEGRLEGRPSEKDARKEARLRGLSDKALSVEGLASSLEDALTSEVELKDDCLVKLGNSIVREALFSEMGSSEMAEKEGRGDGLAEKDGRGEMRELRRLGEAFADGADSLARAASFKAWAVNRSACALSTGVHEPVDELCCTKIPPISKT